MDNFNTYTINNNNNKYHLLINNKSCNSNYLFKFINKNIYEKKTCILCKKCNKLFIKNYYINNNIYYCYNNNIYDNLLEKNIIGNINNNGNIYLINNNIYINLISINKIKYYLINNYDLFDININIFNIDLKLKIGKLLGPNICIVKKNMIIINKIKFNQWKIIN